MTYQERIDTAESLDDLCGILTVIEYEMAALREENDSTSPNVGEHIYLAGLPVFGGITPDDTIGIWSWDSTRILVAEGTHWATIDRQSWIF